MPTNIKNSEIIEAIVSYTTEHGYAPSFKEIGEMVGFRSSGTMYHHISDLINEKKIETDARQNSARAIRVKGYGFIENPEYTAQVLKKIEEQNREGAETRKNVYRTIIDYILCHGYPPTVRELCELSGIKSASTMSYHINILINDGMIETDADRNVPRAIRIPGLKYEKRNG